jgi:hypothetical protein
MKIMETASSTKLKSRRAFTMLLFEAQAKRIFLVSSSTVMEEKINQPLGLE